MTSRSRPSPWWDRSQEWSQFRSTRRQRGWWLGRVRRAPRVLRRSSARGEVRGVRSAARCGVTRRSADGPARRSSSVSRRGGRDHRQFARCELPDAATGWPGRQDEAPREELLAGPGPGPGATRAHLRTNRPLEKKPGTMAGLAQGWAGHPFHSRQMQLTSRGTPAPDALAPRLVTHWAVRDQARDLCLSSDSCLL